MYSDILLVLIILIIGHINPC